MAYSACQACSDFCRTNVSQDFPRLLADLRVSTNDGRCIALSSLSLSANRDGAGGLLSDALLPVINISDVGMRVLAA